MPNVVFNGFDFNANGWKIDKVFHESSPDRTIDVGAIAGNDGFSILEDKFEKKIIRAFGTILADSRELLNAAIEDGNAQMLTEGQEELGVHDDDGSSRYWNATIQRIELPRERFNDSHVEFEVTFLADPFSVDGVRRIIQATGITSSPYNADYSIDGSAEPLPDIKITVNSATTFSALKFKVVTTGDEITITRSFSASDVVIIAMATKTVFVNGVEVAYDGIFPKFKENEVNRISITTTATARNYDLEIGYLARFK